MKTYAIPFNRPFMSPKAQRFIRQAHQNGHLSGDGPFSRRCQRWLEKTVGCQKAFMTPSGTSALEMAVVLAGIEPGDEVIMPSFTFVSTANAVVLRGATPVFIDIRRDTLNMDESQIGPAVTRRTKAILAVHYGGVGCAMRKINALARERRLKVIEDAAHAVRCRTEEGRLGSLGHFGAMSFHETKPLHCGEGGAVFINDRSQAKRAEIIREKGTDRTRFFRGEVSKYSWQELGSSYLMSELCASFLWAQFKDADRILGERLLLWAQYHERLEPFEKRGLLQRPHLPKNVVHNGYLYYLLLPDARRRSRFIEGLAKKGILAVFHYVPLHSSPGGKRYSRSCGTLPVTCDISKRIVRLPLWVGLRKSFEYVIDSVSEVLNRL